MKIYTKTGDEGQTGLLGGARTPKTSARIMVIGDVDELNAAIGLARTASDGLNLDADLGKIQNWLFDLGAELACPPEGKIQSQNLTAQQIAFLEESIDLQEARLEPLKQFILPGGSTLSAHLHFARSVCRRAERSILVLNDLEPQRQQTRVFLNRLSDWLFTAARTANVLTNVKDVPWCKTEA